MDDYMSLSAKAFAVCLFFLWFFSRNRKLSSTGKSNLNLPPSPPALPVIGHLHLLGSRPHHALNELSTRLGPLLHLRLGSVPFVVASDADTAKEFLSTHELFFSDRPRTKVIDCLYYGVSGFVFAPYGDHWRFMKKLCVSELLGGRTLERLRWIRREEIGRFFQTLHQKAEKREAVDMGAELVRLTSNVICQMVMSRRCSGEDDGEAFEVRKLMEEASEIAGKFNVADFVGFCKNLDPQGLQKRVEGVRRRFDGMMEGIIREREDVRRRTNVPTCTEGHDSEKDLLDILLGISEDEGKEIRLTREDIKIFVQDIFAAGTDTAAITMEWAMAELINNPAILHRAREEIDSVVGEPRAVGESDIPNLPFLQAIVKETLRLHPAVPLIFRQSTRHCKVMGYDIPSNTRLLVNVWAMGRDPRQWENPLEFRPERFMGDGGSAGGGDGVDVRGRHFQLLPFGSGRRGCPGLSLALQVMQTTLGAMIQCFEWRVEERSVDMAEGEGLTLPRAHPLLCTPAVRQPKRA